jgi:hypothetical protein
MQIKAELAGCEKLLVATLPNGRMISPLTYRLLKARAQVSWLVLVTCATLVFSATLAHAHAPVSAPSNAVPRVSVAHQVSATNLNAAEHAGHACPVGAKHKNHQTCIGGSAPHAMTIGAEIRTDLYPRPRTYEVAASAASDGREVAPLIHPPNL